MLPPPLHRSFYFWGTVHTAYSYCNMYSFMHMHLCMVHAEKEFAYFSLCNYFICTRFPYLFVKTRADVHLRCLFPIFLLHFSKLVLPSVTVIYIVTFASLLHHTIWFKCFYCSTICLLCSCIAFDNVVRHTQAGYNAITFTAKERNGSCMFTRWLMTTVNYRKHMVCVQK